MAGTLTYFAALFSATLTLMIGSGLHGSLLSMKMTFAGYDSRTIGVVMTGLYIGMIAGTWFCPVIIRRSGHIRAFAVFAAINTVAILLHAMYVAPWFWWGLRLFTGFALMGSYMVVESWLNEKTEPNHRGRVFSVYMAMTFLGLGLGQFLLNFGDIHGQDLFIEIAVFYALCLIPVSLSRAVNPEPPETTEVRLVQYIRAAPLGMVGSLAAGINAGAFFTLGPVFGLKSGLNVSLVAGFMGLTILAGLILQWPVGNFSDRFDRRCVLGVLSLAVALASLGVIMSGGVSPKLLLFSGALYGGVAFTVYPVAVAHANDFFKAEDRVGGSATIILFYGCGAFLGPMVAPLFMAWNGPAGLFGLICGNSAVLALVALTAAARSKKVVREPIPTIPVPRTSHLAVAFDPRMETEEDASAEPGQEKGKTGHGPTG